MSRSIALVVAAGLQAVGLLAGGCSSAPAEEAQAAPEGPRRDAVLFPKVEIPATDEPMTFDAAQEAIGKIEEGFPPPAGHRLRAPKSLDDVKEILQLDQVNLYTGAIDLAMRTPGLEAKVLEAQIELAWGESYSLVMSILLDITRYLEGKAVQAESSYNLTAAQQHDLEQLHTITEQASVLAEAFNVLSVQHASRGARLAQDVMEGKPDDYLGYRLAADYYRTVRRWDQFDKMVDKVAELKPDSNGLIFLRAAAAFSRDEDRGTAEDLFNQALRNDPRFVRAQVHKIVIQPDVAAIKAQLDVLRGMNKDHQVVLWLGRLVDFAAAF